MKAFLMILQMQRRNENVLCSLLFNCFERLFSYYALVALKYCFNVLLFRFYSTELIPIVCFMETMDEDFKISI